MSQNQEPDGGPAFPHIDPVTPEGSGQCYEGLTKREYFAAHAPFTLADVVAYLDEKVTYDRALKTLAQMRFSFADAMIAAEAGHG